MNKKQLPKSPSLPWDNPRFRNWVSVAKAAQAVGRAMTDALAPLDMKPAQLDMLMNIYRHPGMSQQELAEKLIVGRSNITMLMPGLVSRGIVTRTGDKGDKRIQRLTMTDEGTKLLMQALAIYSDLIDKAMAAATPQECDRVGAQMMKIIEALKAQPENQ
ncbi:MAG: MarR family transcriptional regulator [Rhizobiaceae bacterium]